MQFSLYIVVWRFERAATKKQKSRRAEEQNRAPTLMHDDLQEPRYDLF